MMRQAVRRFLRFLSGSPSLPVGREEDPEELTAEELAQVSETLGGDVQRGVRWIDPDLEYPPDAMGTNKSTVVSSGEIQTHPLATRQSSPELRQQLDEAARESKAKDKPGRLFKVTGSGLKPVKP